VELHGGSVEAHSDGLGQGSEFVVRLPLRSRAQVKSARRGARAGGREPRSALQRILIVDDNVDAAESQADLLRLSGHEVQVAHSGPAALEVGTVFQPEVVLLDLGMPGMDGYETARELRGREGLQSARLVALSGYGSGEDRRRTREAGFDAHLVKPVHHDALLELLASLLPVQP
jgi:CheY-like chemotaxis protein